jgi:hypothetical protein
MSAEVEIRHGVFVSAIQAGLMWERRDAGEGSKHLLGSPFKEAPTAAGKERVSSKQRTWVARDIVERVSARVAWRVQALYSQVRDFNSLQVADATRREKTAILKSASDYSDSGATLCNHGILPGVIGVIMRRKDSNEARASWGRIRVQAGRGKSGVNQDRFVITIQA